MSEGDVREKRKEPGPLGACVLGSHDRIVAIIWVMTPKELARRIAEIAVLRGTFTLRSGRRSNYYIDK